MSFEKQAGFLTAEVTHWRADEDGAHLRLWVKDERGRVVSLASLSMGERFLEDVYRETVSTCEAARQMQLRLWP